MLRFRTLDAISRPLTRSMSQESLIDLTIDKEGIALMTMKRFPVNALNLQMLQEINSTLDMVQKNEYKGLVITSATKVFSAGLDLNELNKPEIQALHTFSKTLQNLYLMLYGCGETTTTVAINGYSAAGGCILALMCDYRVMVSDSKAKIGLNDTAVGIVPGPWVCDLMNRTMGKRETEIALTASSMYTAEEALKVHLVDEIASDKEEAIEKCNSFIRKYDNIPIKIKAKTKRNLRAEPIRLFEENRNEDFKRFVNGILDPYAQEQIDFYVQQLKSKRN